MSLIICAFAAAGKQQTVSSEDKLKQITNLAAKSKGNVITLDDSTYAYYATAKPRPYNLVVFLTANHPKFKCGVCKQIDTELALLASSYVQQSKADKEEQNTFFLRLDYESSQKTFSSYSLNSVPMLFFVASEGNSYSKGSFFLSFSFHVEPN
jgi:hypothetical protein